LSAYFAGGSALGGDDASSWATGSFGTSDGLGGM